MTKYQVTRTWIVEANSTADAIAKTKPGEHIEVRAEKLPTKTRMEKIVEEYVYTAIENSRSGGGHPADIPLKREAFLKARDKFKVELDKLIKAS